MKILLYSFCLYAVALSACSSVKTAGAKTKAGTLAAPESATESLCNRTVKYYIEKSIVTMETGEEREDNRAVEIVVNQNDGRFTMITSQDDRKGPLEMKIISCNLAAGMKSGEALCEIIDEELLENGETVINRIKMLVEANKGTVAISLSDQVSPGKMKSDVARWEVMD
jgi:hypothetical protein